MILLSNSDFEDLVSRFATSMLQARSLGVCLFRGFSCNEEATVFISLDQDLKAQLLLAVEIPSSYLTWLSEEQIGLNSVIFI